MSKIMSLFFDWQEVSGAGGGVLLAGVQGTAPHLTHATLHPDPPPGDGAHQPPPVQTTLLQCHTYLYL